MRQPLTARSFSVDGNDPTSNYGATVDMELQTRLSGHRGSITPKKSSREHDYDDDTIQHSNLSQKITRTGVNYHIDQASQIFDTNLAGRQRKKSAARKKGGDFQTKREKRRIYFCCISNEIDLEEVQKSLESFSRSDEREMRTKMYEDVLHSFVDGTSHPDHINEQYDEKAWSDQEGIFRESVHRITEDTVADPRQNASALWAQGGKELFVFEFGAMVFWGYSQSEEVDVVNMVSRNHVRNTRSPVPLHLWSHWHLRDTPR